jgi:hypothetical protein
MKAIIYTIKMYDSMTDYAHGFSQSIKEYYIPEKGIYFNCVHNKINIFESDKSRYEKGKFVSEIDLLQEHIDILLQYLRIEKEAEIIVKKIMEGIK